MEAVFTYLIKSGALIATFWLAYYLLLRQETFFKSNRWFLLSGLVTSVILPFVTFKKVIWVEPNPDNLHWATFPGEAVPLEQSFEINWWIVAGIVYLIGIAAFLLRFCTDFYSLRKALRGKRITQQADFKFIDTMENISPFSYFSYIVYNSSLYSPMELQNILEHEKVHSDQHHSIDVLITRVFCIVFWFNPFVWLYKKSILQNLEFIADSEATKDLADKKSYQFTLLKVTAHENCVDITNHFFQSLIKKRIVMLNKNQSKKRNSWKYVLVIPALAAFMFYFQVKVIAQEKEILQTVERTLPPQGSEIVVDKNTSDGQLKAYAEKAKKEHGVALKFTKVKRNKSGEITGIKAEFKSETGKKGITQVSGDEPIAPIRFYKHENGTIGFGTGRPRDGRTLVNFEHAHNDGDDVLEMEIPELPYSPDAPSPPDAPELPGDVDAIAPPHPPHPPAKVSKHVIIRNGNGEKPMVIVDGEIIVDGEKMMKDLDPLTIEKMNVIKGEGSKMYNKDGKDVIIIDTKKITKDALKKAREEMRRAGPIMDKAMRDTERALRDTDRAREDMNSNRENLTREEMTQMKKELEQAREEMKKAKLEIEKSRKELEKENSGNK